MVCIIGRKVKGSWKLRGGSEEAAKMADPIGQKENPKQKNKAGTKRLSAIKAGPKERDAHLKMDESERKEDRS